MVDRRTLLKTGAAGTGLATFAAGYADTAGKLVSGALDSLVAPASAASVDGASLAPEYTVDARGALTVNPGQQVSYSMCMGCTTFCGVRVRVDKASGRVLRVSGNPYHPLSTDPVLAPDTPIRDSFIALSRMSASGYESRSTACGRGAAVLTQMTSPYRVTQPLKRVGPRGGGTWQPISFEQLIKEVVEGGDLFGEGKVDGLAAIRSMEPIDPSRPELGPKANQLACLTSTNEGRENFVRRFVQKAFGSINMTGHGGYCGGSYRSGSAAVFGDMKQMPHAKPDFANAEFILFCGTAPANAGNPFKRQGFQVAKRRAEGRLSYVVVDPVIGHSDSMASRHKGRWIPIRPATDGALAMGMIRWIIEARRYDARYLSQPNGKLAAAAGEPSFSNATHLVIAEPGHARDGFHLRGSDIGLPVEGAQYGEKDPYVVVEAGTGRLIPHDQAAGPAELFVDATLPVGDSRLKLKTGLDLLKDSAFARTIAEYAEICGIPVEVIEGLAKEFTSHGKKAAVNSHGGTMAGNGFYNAFSLVTLNTLVGNLNAKGGTMIPGGAFPAEGAGPRYDLDSFAGATVPRGTPLARPVPYERSSEFKRKKEAGKAYPAEQPWYPNTPQLGTELMNAALTGYPYQTKAMIFWTANPVYGIPGLRARFEAALKDSKRIPLMIAIDAFINETGAFADYIVPDTVMYESWGFAAPWHGVPTRTSTARWPVVEPALQKTAAGHPIDMEAFLIACARTMGLPGFGPGALKDKDGTLQALETAADYYLRAAANVAFGGQKPVNDATDDDITLVGLDRLLKTMQATLKPEEWRKAAHVLARGGRFQPADQAYKGAEMATKFPRALMLYNETVGVSRSAITGKRFSGVARWVEPSFADGTPMRQRYPVQDWPMLLASQKSVLMNSYSIGVDRLRGIHAENPVSLHVEDAKALGIVNGDRIRIATPTGAVEGRALVRHGVMRGAAVVEHGFGHKELGARAHRIGGKSQPENGALSAGINLNDIGLADPTLKDASVWLDPVAGSAVRQGLPARITRIA